MITMLLRIYIFEEFNHYLPNNGKCDEIHCTGQPRAEAYWFCSLFSNKHQCIGLRIAI